jgi:hypothetical protein
MVSSIAGALVRARAGRPTRVKKDVRSEDDGDGHDRHADGCDGNHEQRSVVAVFSAQGSVLVTRGGFEFLTVAPPPR